MFTAHKNNFMVGNSGSLGPQLSEGEIDNFLTAPKEKTTTSILQEEGVFPDYMEIDDKTKPLGFTNKNFNHDEFIKRKQLINTYEWTTTDTGEVTTLNLPNDMIKGPILNKFDDFSYLHAGMDILVRINPQPFQTGTLMVVAGPVHTNFDSNFTHLSFLPHVLININITNTNTLHIPFFSDKEAYIKENIWKLTLYVISPLTSTITGDTVDVEIFGAFTSPLLMLPMAQATNETLQQSESGTITNITGAVADTLEGAGSVLNNLPVIGSYMPPLTWLARTLNRVSAHFGWSRPINLEIPTINTPMPAPRLCQGEGIDNSVSLGFIPDNATTCINTGSTDQDEMDFTYLFERKYIRIIKTIPTNIIYSTYLNTGHSTDVLPNRLLDIFHLKRYTVSYEFHITKTFTHTGRLLITLARKSGYTTQELKELMNTNYSKIIDIATTDRFTFTVPWLQDEPFSSGSDAYIYISTLTPIKAPDTVVQSITLIVYESKRDVEVGYLTSDTSTISTFPKAQLNCCGNSEPINDDGLIPYPKQMMSQYCIGENVQNLRLMGKSSRAYIKVLVTQLGFDYNPSMATGLFAFIHDHFAWRSGGYRIKILMPKHIFLKISLSSIHQPTTTQIFDSSMNSIAEITVPFYSATRRVKEVSSYPEVHLIALDQTTLEPINVTIHLWTSLSDDSNFYFPYTNSENVLPGTAGYLNPPLVRTMTWKGAPVKPRLPPQIKRRLGASTDNH